MPKTTTKKEPLLLGGSNLFHTYKSKEELYEYFDSHAPRERMMLHVGASLMMNLIVHVMVTECDGKAEAEPIPTWERKRKVQNG